MTDKVVIIGYVYPTSRQNGFVITGGGVSPCLGVGCHSGVEPKLRVLIENG